MHSQPVKVTGASEQAASILRLAMLLNKDENDAKDVSQDAWIAVQGAPPREIHSMRGWLRGLVRHKSIRVLYRRTRREEVEISSYSTQTEESPLDLLVRNGLREQLDQALDRIALIYSVPLRLRYFEELSLLAIVERVELPLETVRSRLRRGLILLRSIVSLGL